MESDAKVDVEFCIKSKVGKLGNGKLHKSANISIGDVSYIERTYSGYLQVFYPHKIAPIEKALIVSKPYLAHC